MEFSRVVRERRSTRHYDQRPIERDVVAEIIEEASWAPSAGNTQPWRVVVLTGEPLRELVNRFEPGCLDLLLPGAKLAILEAAEREGRRVDPAQLNRQMIASLPLFELSSAPPSHLLVVCHETPSAAQRVRELAHSASIALHRLRQKNRPGPRLRYLWSLFSGWTRLFAMARAVRMASLSNYAYALTLCAHDRGIDSCIIGSFGLAGRSLRCFVGLAAGERIAAVVALGHGRTGPGEPVARTRWPVPTRWITG